MEIKLAFWWQIGKIAPSKRGYSLMAKLQPSKLAMRVRFPLPASVQ